MGEGLAGDAYQSASGRHWFLVSSRSPLHDGRPGLIHQFAAGEKPDATLFRGYLANAGIHSYSSADQIREYWCNRSGDEHNGVFACARIEEDPGRLTLVTDAFGVSPLYYREVDGCLMFASHPHFITLPDEAVDWVNWRCLLQSSYLTSDRSLWRDIRRLPAGSSLVADKGGIRLDQWFDFNSLPDGSEEITEESYQSVETAVQNAMDRCVALKVGTSHLPLSSGYDSRRLLAFLRSRGIDPRTYTVHTFDRRNGEYYDLELPGVSEIVRQLDLDHQLIPMPDIRGYADNDRIRRNAFSAHVPSHNWAVELAKNLRPEPGAIYDGLAGDTFFGYVGFGVQGLYEDPARDRRLIAERIIRYGIERTLKPGFWPPAGDVRAEVEDYLSGFPENTNHTLYAYFMLRTRRNTATWMQQMLPVGQVVVCPFLDLEVIRATFRYHPGRKAEVLMQEGCLKRFWPDYLGFPGTRKGLAGLQPIPAKEMNGRVDAIYRQMLDELRDHDGISLVRQMLSPKYRLVFEAGRIWPGAMRNMDWAYRGLMETASQHVRHRPCWTRDGGS